MSALGAIVSLTLAGAYAAFDRARVDYKIKTSNLPVERVKNDQMFHDIVATFRDNWEFGGASLFPKKLIPFLSLDDRIRNMWIEEAAYRIVYQHGFDITQAARRSTMFSGRSDLPYGIGAGSYCGTVCDDNDQSKKILGPMYYEYDFVATNYPDDWAAYNEALRKMDKEEEQQIHKESSECKTLLILGAITSVVAAIIIFCGFKFEWWFQMSHFVCKFIVTAIVLGAASPFIAVLRKKQVPLPMHWRICIILLIIWWSVM